METHFSKWHPPSARTSFSQFPTTWLVTAGTSSQEPKSSAGQHPAWEPHGCFYVILSHPAKPKRSAAWLEEPPTQMPSCPDRASSEKGG